MKKIDEIAVLFNQDDDLSKLYSYLKEKIEENKNYNVSSLFDNFEIKANSLIDKVINYTFPKEEVFETYLSDTIKRIKIYELEKLRDQIKTKMLNATTDEEKYEALNQLTEITNRISKEKK